MPLFGEQLEYFVVALALAAILVPLMRALSFRLGAVDKGEGRRVHSGIIPRLGGVGIYGAFLIPTIYMLLGSQWNPDHTRFMGILLGSLVIVGIGFYDDLKGAKVSHKLLAEVIAALIIYVWGIRIEHLTIPLFGSIQLGWISLPVTLFWIVAITNAVNLIDGLDGLAAGTGICVSLILLFTAISGQEHLQLTCITLIGALAGFLIYNFPPATIFMGDAGSLFVGFLLGALSIQYSVKATALATMMVPLIAFSIPLLDMTYAVGRRYYRGLALGSADKEHIHHKLLDKGFSKRGVLGVIFLANIVIMGLAVLMLEYQGQGPLWVSGAIFLLAVAGIRLLGYQKFLPLWQSMKRNYHLNKKRRYHNFLIRKFKQQAKQPGTAADLHACLASLMEHYGFSSARIDIYQGNETTVFWEYGSLPQGDNTSLVASVPLATKEGVIIGRMFVAKDMVGDYLLCSAKLFSSISEVVEHFLALTYARETPTPINALEEA